MPQKVSVGIIGESTDFCIYNQDFKLNIVNHEVYDQIDNRYIMLLLYCWVLFYILCMANDNSVYIYLTIFIFIGKERFSRRTRVFRGVCDSQYSALPCIMLL